MGLHRCSSNTRRTSSIILRLQAAGLATAIVSGDDFSFMCVTHASFFGSHTRSSKAESAE